MAPKGSYPQAKRMLFQYGKALLCSNNHQREVKCKTYSVMSYLNNKRKQTKGLMNSGLLIQDVSEKAKSPLAKRSGLNLIISAKNTSS
jgi:hypothetical protein